MLNIYCIMIYCTPKAEDSPKASPGNSNEYKKVHVITLITGIPLPLQPY